MGVYEKMAPVCSGFFHLSIVICLTAVRLVPATQLKVRFESLDFIDPVGHLMVHSKGFFSFNGLDSVYSCSVFSGQDFNVSGSHACKRQSFACTR